MRVLHVIGAMNRAGAETFLMNLYRQIDRDRVQFDFLVHTDKPSDYDEEINSLGGKIYTLPPYYLFNQKRYRLECRRFFQSHPEHPIVHGHIGSSAPIYLQEAKRAQRYTIAHSHSVSKNNSLTNIAFNVVAHPVRRIADYFMACSSEAAESRFGKQISESNLCSIVTNGIIANRYHRTPDRITEAKRRFGVDEAPTFGHVGRLTYEKNHPFLLEVFSKIRKELPDARLLLAGCGEAEGTVQSLITKLHLDEAVTLTGVQENIPLFLNALDVFLFPSFSEGLGIALIEAQAAGLQSIASTGVPEAAFLTDRAYRIPISDTSAWVAQSLASYEKSLVQTDDQTDLVAAKGYDIKGTARWLTDFYERNLHLRP